MPVSVILNAIQTCAKIVAKNVCRCWPNCLVTLRHGMLKSCRLQKCCGKSCIITAGVYQLQSSIVSRCLTLFTGWMLTLAHWHGAQHCNFNALSQNCCCSHLDIYQARCPQHYHHRFYSFTYLPHFCIDI